MIGSHCGVRLENGYWNRDLFSRSCRKCRRVFVQRKRVARTDKSEHEKRLAAFARSNPGIEIGCD